MIFGKLFYFEKGTSNLDTAREILRSYFKLVEPIYYPFGKNKLLVWEDNEGIGRYRVHFYNNLPLNNIHYEGIQFKYWMNSRMKGEIFEKDPMKDAMDYIRTSLDGELLEKDLTKDKTIEEVLRNYYN